MSPLWIFAIAMWSWNLGRLLLLAYEEISFWLYWRKRGSPMAGSVTYCNAEEQRRRAHIEAEISKIRGLSVQWFDERPTP